MFRRIGEAAGFGGPSRGSGASGGPPAGGSPGAPLELIKYDGERFLLGEEALAVLRKIRGPVAVIAVSGRARQGKSFILNQLLGRSTGFQVAPSVRPCTKGLWMWSTPIERTNEDGSKYHLVLLDTEGIDAYDQTGQYSTQIFSLAVLLSSLFVYNQMGGIDEAALDRLSLVTEVTKHIRVRAGTAAGESSASELAAFTPTFLWLLRDFYLSLEEDGRQTSPKEYLESALAPLPGTDRGTASKNAIRESITALFPERDCFPLVRPVADEKALQALDSLPASQLRPEFRQGLERLTKLMFGKAQPKRLGQDVVSGGVLAALATAYVDAINGGAVPTIATAWQGVAEAECRRAADAAEAAYAAEFREDVEVEESALEAEHRRALQKGEDVYAEGSIGDPSVRRAGDQRWRRAAEARFAQVKQARLASAALACEQLINQATSRLSQAARAPGATVEGLQAQLAGFEKEYAAAPGARGPTKWRRHAEFMRDTVGGILHDVAARQETAVRQELSAAKERATDLSSAVQRAEAAATRSQQDAATAEARALRAEDRAAAAGRQLEEQRRAAQQAETRLASVEAQLQAADLRREADVAAARREAEVQVKRLRTEGDTAQRQLTTARGDLASAQAEADSLRRQLEGAGTTSRAEVERLRAAVAAAEGAARTAASERDAAQTLEQQASREAAQALEEQEELRKRIQELAARASPGRRSAPSPTAAAAAAPEPMDADGDAGYATPDDDQKAPAADAPDPAKMTIAEMKAWLMDAGQEARVWELTQGKAKKAQWVALVRDTM